MSKKAMHSINGRKENIRFSQNMHFWVKNHFSEILKFLQILLAPLAFFEAVDMD